jgi:hypothetical protein
MTKGGRVGFPAVFVAGLSKQQVPPTTVGMTKERMALPFESSC